MLRYRGKKKTVFKINPSNLGWDLPVASPEQLPPSRPQPASSSDPLILPAPATARFNPCVLLPAAFGSPPVHNRSTSLCFPTSCTEIAKAVIFRKRFKPGTPTFHCKLSASQFNFRHGLFDSQLHSATGSATAARLFPSPFHAFSKEAKRRMREPSRFGTVAIADSKTTV